MKLKPYPKYKDSGIQWIGKIPEGWEVRRIKTIFYEINKQSTTGAEELLSVSDIYGIKKRSEIIGPDDHLTHAETLIGYKKCKKGDLVINIMLAWKGAIGVSAYDGIVSPAYCVYRIKNHNPKYFHYLFRVNLVTNQFKRYSSGIIDSRLRLYPEEFFRIETIVPPLPDQTAITHFLDKKNAKIDSLIEKDKKLIALLKEKRTTLINHIVTKGLDPNVKLKDSGIAWIGEIPKGWEVHRLKFKETVTMGQSPDSESYNYEYRGYPFLQGNAEFSDVHPNPSIWCDVANKYALKNDILLSVRAPIGAINIADQKYGIGRGLCAIRIKINNLKYIFYQLIACVNYLNSIGTGSTYTAISTEDVMNLPMRYPPLPEQTAIANFLDNQTSKIDKTIQKIEEKIKLLEEYKKSLIHYVVTGKVDVRGVE